MQLSKYLREPMNGFTHFIGIALAITGLVVLLTRSAENTVWHTVSFSIFGAAMIMVFLFSTLYHWLPISGEALKVFRKIDHIMIFVFIAASYTPVCLVTIRGGWGWSIFGVVWGITLFGLFMKIFWLSAPRWLSTALYLLMGWIVVIGIWPIIQNMVSQGIFWMVLGGLFYTTGAVIYGIKKPNPWPHVLGFHEIFHLFILAGSFAHFWMVYKYI